jgi:hypothetical protein
MPYYTFQKGKGNPYVKEMTNAEREQYLKDNPKVIQILTKITMGDSVRLGIKQPPADFQKHILGRMSEALPQNRIQNTNSKFKIPKEI